MTEGIRLACLVSKPLKMSSVVRSRKLIITTQYTTLTAYVQVVCILADEQGAVEKVVNNSLTLIHQDITRGGERKLNILLHTDFLYVIGVIPVL